MCGRRWVCLTPRESRHPSNWLDRYEYLEQGVDRLYPHRLAGNVLFRREGVADPQGWRENIAKHNKEIETVKKKIAVLKDGDPKDGAIGIRQGEANVHRIQVARSRVWPACKVLRKEETGQVSIESELPPPSKDAVNALMFIFEEADMPARRLSGRILHLGDFGQEMAAQAQAALNGREILALRRSRGPWILYQVLPVEDQDFLAQISEDQPGAMLGEVDTAKKNIAAEIATLVEKKLWDYQTEFETYYRDRSLMNDQIASAETDAKATEVSLDNSQKQLKLMATDLEETKKLLAQRKVERDAVVAHHDAVKRLLEKLDKAVADARAQNQQLASAIAYYQLQAAKIIDERTKKMARAGSLGQ